MSRRNVKWFHFWNPNSGWRGGLIASSVLLFVIILVKAVQRIVAL